jgi:hydroxyacylglutathione hydrolase
MHDKDWFKISQIDDFVWLIQEDLSLIEPKFHTKWVNSYFLKGTKINALIDTGTGLFDIRKVLRIIDEYLDSKELFIFNTHHHFDHIGGNSLFPRVHIHKLDFKPVSNPIDVNFLTSAKTDLAKLYEKYNYKIPITDEMIPLIGGEKFDLGGIELKIIYTPGHTMGSICLLSDQKHLFSGDTIHLGAYYLPEHFYWQDLVESLEMLLDLDFINILPGHEEINLDKSVIKQLIRHIDLLDPTSDKIQYDEHLECNFVDVKDFKLIFPLIENF